MPGVKRFWQVLDRSGEASFSYGQYLHEVFADYLRFSESKRLLNQLALLQEREKFKTLALLSEVANEGKSFLALMLAYGFASLLHRRVLLVDAVYQTHGRTLYLDRLMGPREERGMPRPKSEPNPGVIDLLTTRSEEVAHLSTTDFQLGPYIEENKALYDWVLYDTCALNAAGKEHLDPVVISRSADRALLVMSPRSIRAEALTRLKGKLQDWNVRLIGTVYNSGVRK